MSGDEALAAWLADILGGPPSDIAAYRTALTHPSFGGESYQRLEFLGDRVLGLVIAEWLAELHPNETEGKWAERLAVLASGETCAAIAEEIGVPPHLRLGKQARDDGARSSTYVLGDVVEALIAVRFGEAGLDGARELVRRLWGDRARTLERARHPKSELLELAAQRRWRPPAYILAGRSGPHHAPVFTVVAEIHGRDSAEGIGTSKQAAEAEAAKALLEKLR